MRRRVEKERLSGGQEERRIVGYEEKSREEEVERMTGENEE